MPPPALGVEPEKDAETGVGAADPGVDPGVADSCRPVSYKSQQRARQRIGGSYTDVGPV